MKTKTAFFNSLLLVFLLNLPSKAEEKTNLAVAEFDGRNVSAMDACAVSDFVRTGFVNTNLFNIVNRGNMQQILDEQKFQATGCTSQECAVKMGKLLNVQKMIVGSVIKLGQSYYINASAIDVETGQITSSQKVESDSLEKLAPKAEDLAGLISEEISGRKPGNVLSSESLKRPFLTKIIDKDTVVINRGTFDDFKEQQIFDIFDQINSDKIGRLRITKAGFNDSEAKIIRNYGRTPKPGNIVKYSAKQRQFSFGGTSGYTQDAFVYQIENQDATGNHHYGEGAMFFVEYIYKTGLGIQANFGKSSIATQLHYGNGYWWGNYESYKAINQYLYPLLVKYHFFSDFSISPYLGAGISYFERYYYYRILGYLLPSVETNNNGIAPVLNIGIDFFANKFFSLSIDSKYYIGSDFHGFSTRMHSLNIGLSLNW